MADIVIGYNPANTVAFSSSGWNGDFYSTTDGVSIYGELNGHVQDANFAAGQTFDARHVRPFEGFRAEFSGALETVDFHEHLFGPEYRIEDWLIIPGTSKRLYLAWEPTVAIFRASCFVTNFRLRKLGTGGITDLTAPEMYVGLFVDNVLVSHSLRRLPVTYYPIYGGTFPYAADARTLWGHENVLSHHFDLMEMLDVPNCPAGDHDVDLRCLVLQNEGVEKLFPLYDTNIDALGEHTVTHRIRGGIRSASILGLW